MDNQELSGISILVAEDDEGILTLLKSFLQSSGANVTVEEHGRDILTRVEEVQPDIILLDVVMPFVDGLTVLGNLRKAGCKIPVIMLTDKSTVDDKVKGLEFGADDYMTKPFSTKELLARIKSVLRRAEQDNNEERASLIEVGGIEIRPLSREVIVESGSTLQLTKTEFDLLNYLAQRKSEVVAHTDLLSHVLGYKNYVETKALVMHIANIRKKMAKAMLEGVRIETVAGVGYKLMEV